MRKNITKTSMGRIRLGHTRRTDKTAKGYEMKLKTNITFHGSLTEIVADLETWKKADPTRAKLVTKCPATLKLTITNYEVKAKRYAAVSEQRTIWPEEADKLPKLIATGITA